MTPLPWLPLAELRGRLRTHPLRLSEVPVEFEVSFPVPTRRFGPPAYAWFAGPCVRRPDGPAEHAPPDRWWAIDAATGRLLVYALAAVHPFADLPAAPVVVPVPPRSVADQRAAVERLEAALTAAATAFFAGLPDATRPALREAVGAVLPDGLRPTYRALAPDFFDWLDG